MVNLDAVRLGSKAEKLAYVPLMHDEIKTLRDALEESVKLQSFYAEMLNGYDGGERRKFANAEEWVERLRECREQHRIK